MPKLWIWFHMWPLTWFCHQESTPLTAPTASANPGTFSKPLIGALTSSGSPVSVSPVAREWYLPALEVTSSLSCGGSSPCSMASYSCACHHSLACSGFNSFIPRALSKALVTASGWAEVSQPKRPAMLVECHIGLSMISFLPTAESLSSAPHPFRASPRRNAVFSGLANEGWKIWPEPKLSIERQPWLL